MICENMQIHRRNPLTYNKGAILAARIWEVQGCFQIRSLEKIFKKPDLEILEIKENTIGEKAKNIKKTKSLE